MVPDSNAFAADRFDSTAVTGEPFQCTDFEGFDTRELAVSTMLAADDDVQYPGAILQWTSLAGVTPLAVLVDRAGSALSLTAPAGGGEISGAVEEISGQSVAAWRQDALAELGLVAPGPWAVTAGVVYNSDHLAVLAGLAPTNMTAEASQRLVVRSEGPGRAFVRLQRTHHSVNCPYPEDSRAAFAPHITGTDLEEHMAEGNPPVWLSTVDYGQLLLVLVEADAGDAEVIEAAVNSFVAAAAGRTPDAGAPLVHDLPGVAVSVFAEGADADAAEAASVAGFDQLTDFLQAVPAEPGALPAITGSLLALRNGGPIARGVTADTDFTSCVIFEPVFDQVLWAFEAADAHTELVVGDLDTDGTGDFFYDGNTSQFTELLVDFIPDLVGDGEAALPRGRRPFLLPEAANGHPAVELYDITIDEGTLRSELKFEGGGIVARDYTIFIVCGMPRQVTMRYTVPTGHRDLAQLNQTDYFLHGTGSGETHNMMVGYPDRETTIYSHQPYHVHAIHRPSPGHWHVYALSFGIETGMALYYDGELLTADSTDDRPLLEFSGATICARWHELGGIGQSVFWMVEAAAYAGAGDAESIRSETIRLDEKYDLGLDLAR